MHSKKRKKSIAFIVILAMLMQVIGPMTLNVFADENEDIFRVLNERYEDNVIYIDWEFKLRTDKKLENDFIYRGDFLLENSITGELISDNNITIGTYSISTDGVIAIGIDEELYDIVEEDALSDIVSEEGGGVYDTPAIPADDDEYGDDKEDEDIYEDNGPLEVKGEEAEFEHEDEIGNEQGPSDDIYPENEFYKEEDGNNDPELEMGNDEEPPVTVENFLATLVSATDSIEGLFEFDESSEVDEIVVKYYKGTIVIPGASEKPKMKLLSGGIGLFDEDEGKDLGNIFTYVGLWLGRERDSETGKIIEGKEGEEIEEGTVIVIDEGTTVQMELDWDTQDKDAKSEDYATYVLPDIFKQFTVSNQPIMVSTDDGLQQVGVYSINNGTLRFEFNSNIEGSDVKEGYVGLNLEFNLEKFTENIIQEVKFEDEAEKNFRIIKETAITASAISKSVEPVGRSKHNTKELEWTIYVANTGDSDIENASLEDIIPAGLKMPDTVTLTEMSIGSDGKLYTKTDGSPDIKNFDGIELSDEGGVIGFEIDNLNIKAYTGYKVEYATKIEDLSAENFENNATLSYGEDDYPANVKIEELTRDNPIEKSGTYKGFDETFGADIIEWTIDVNKTGMVIDGAKVYDILPADVSLELVPDSIEIKKLTKGSGDNWNESDKTATSFSIELGDLDENDAYRIKFKTTIDYSKINEGNYQVDNEFTNVVKLMSVVDGDEIKIGEDNTTVKFSREPIIEKSEISNISYTDKELTWQLEINKARHPLIGVIVEDIIPEGLNITKDNIKIYKSDGTTEVATSPFDNKNWITIADGDVVGTKKITMNLGDIGTNHYKIKYTTAVTALGTPSFLNNAGIKGTGIGDGNTWIYDSKTITLPSNIYTKSYVSTDYSAKTITWKIAVDPKRDPIKELTITDTFPNKGLILLPENDFVVNLGNITLEKGIDYTLEPNFEGEGDSKAEGYHKGFILTFDEKYKTEPLNNEITITYKTSFDPQKEVEGNYLEPHTGEPKVYKNKASFSGTTKTTGNISTFDDDKTILREDSWLTGKKEGQLIHFEDGVKKSGWASGYDRKIAWQVYVNYLNQDLGTGVTVTDAVYYSGAIEENSFIVSVYDVKSNGETEIKPNTELNNPSDYTIIIDNEKSNPTFTLAFNNTVTERYVIEFITTVPDISLNKYTNKAGMASNSLEYIATVTYKDYNEFLKKEANGLDGTNVYTGDELEWEIKVNEGLSIIENAEIIDTISKGLTYIDGSLSIVKKVGTTGVDLAEGEEGDYTLSKVINTDGTTFLTLNFIKPIKDTLIITYRTVVTEKNVTVNNKVTFSGTGIEVKPVESEKLTARQFSWVGGTLDPKKGALKIAKIDKNGDTITSGTAKFTLWYKINESDEEYTQFGEEAFTTTNGVITIGGLPLRDYILKEEEAPEGYLIEVEDTSITIDKKYSNNEGNIIKAEVVNTKINGAIKITKEDNEGNPVEGAEFGLFLPESEEPIEEFTGDTDEYGNLMFNNVPYGSYTIKEINTPKGYIKSDVTKTVTIDAEKHGETQEFTFTNTRIHGFIELHKQDTKENPLEGAGFTLYNSEGEELETVMSNDEGVVLFERIPYGNYNIKETKAPEGYKADFEKVIEVSITEEDHDKVVTKDIGDDDLIVTNMEFGRIAIVKVDSANANRRLSGAEFKIKDSEGNYLKDSSDKEFVVITDKDGKAMFKDLEYGIYTVLETRAPSGYSLNREEFEVTVGDGENEEIEVELIVKNTKIPESGGGGHKPKDPPKDDEEPDEPDEPIKPVEPEKPGDEDPKDEEKTVKEETPKDTPKEGDIEIPEGSKPKVNDPPENGTVTVDEDGKWVYTPNPDFEGTDKFSIIVPQPDGTDEEIFFIIDVKPPHDAPEIEKLPQTGEKEYLAFYLIGILLIITGIFTRRRLIV